MNFTSRKFIITTVVLGMAFILTYQGTMDQDTFKNIAIWVAGTYGVVNVAQKIFTDPPVEP